ncbi:hypothetical protein HCN44_009184 [Aphidius gifuensis]|uniref:Major facilitator superfamily (MFS) profile domain-containing protein n=2 Tax=Aphidius gifuensis TaxID=684658 RepID=A0A834Y748_APHGI|nr:monocarboxylate transporter 9-like isoform X1 [Aphidius gifuensis]XP_044016297.1 monocarboxylate transporter 9-like isoform X1 [Aphidius gifuensis]KAF7997786.1 hypothetical protein HCN44_009184 [Aphidius gifuensis]
MQNDKDQDNGINIKFGKDKDGRGEYKKILKNDKKKIKILNGNAKKKQVNDGKTEGELVPPDGGWGWLVLIAAVMVNVLIPGMIKSFGILFVVFMTEFEASPPSAAMIPALCYFLYSSLGPLSSILSVKYSYRTVTLIGGTFAAVGMMLSYYADSVLYLCVSYGVFVGIGAGLSFPPTVYIVTSFFLRLRGLANGLCISGSALGAIFLPPILGYLLREYGYRGAVLIMGALTLNVWASALLYEPVEKHMIWIPKVKKNNQLVEEEDEEYEDDDDNNRENIKDEEITTIGVFVTSPEEEKKFNESLIISTNINDKLPPVVPKSASSVALENYKNTPVQGRSRKISMPTTTGRDIAGQMHSTPALHAVPERGISRRRPTARSPSTSSFNYISTPYHGSTLSALHPQHASTLTLNAISNTFRKSPEKTTKQNDNDIDTKFFDLSLLKDPIYLIILISNSTNAVSYTNFVILLPAYAVSLGFDKDDGGLLLSVVSIFDLIGRIGGSALSDKKIMPKHWYFVGGLIVSGISLALLPTAKTYSVISIWCGIFGLASGVYVGVTAVIMADMLGTEKLTSSYGISLFVNGILQLVGPPICGVIYQFIGSYGPIFSILGIILIAGASLWAFLPFLKRQAANKQICKV